MGHNLFREQMAFVGKTPWHGLGERVPPSVSAEEICRAAGLNWAVHKLPAPGARIVNKEKQLYDRYLVCREPGGDEQSPVTLGLVTAAYEIMQNAEAFDFFRPFIESGLATFHTAGALGNGERVWVLVKLNGQMKIRGDDVVDRFLLLSNVHNGSGAVSVRFTPIRVVCQNTLNLATKNRSAAISIRHTRNLTKNLADAQAQQLLHVIDKIFSDAEHVFSAMASLNTSSAQEGSYLEMLFPRKDKGTIPARWKRVLGILDDRSVTPDGTQKTLWGLYNAVTHDEDYRANRTTHDNSESSANARLSRVWFGSGCDLKIKAYTVAQQFLKNAA